MPGKPKTRERREAEAQERGKSRGNAASVATRRQAVAFADSHGTAVAAKRYAVAPATVRSWRKRLAVEVASEPVSGASAPLGPAGASDDALTEAERRAARAWEIASQALERAAEEVATGDAKVARDLAVTLGILIDKGQRIEAGVTKLRESAARVEAYRAELLRQALHLWASAVGMPLGDHARALLGDLLRQTSDVAVGRLAVKDALAGRAAEEVRRHWTALLEREAAVAAAQAGDDGEDDDELENGEVEEADAAAEEDVEAVATPKRSREEIEVQARRDAERIVAERGLGGSAFRWGGGTGGGRRGGKPLGEGMAGR